jgi:hypothetical protein
MRKVGLRAVGSVVLALVGASCDDSGGEGDVETVQQPPGANSGGYNVPPAGSSPGGWSAGDEGDEESAGGGGAAQGGGSAGNEGGNESAGGGEAELAGQPETLRVTVLQVLLRPGKPDGDQWDCLGLFCGLGDDEHELIESAILDLLSGDVVGALELLQSSALSALSKPDPFGFADLLYAGDWVDGYELPPIQDTFNPFWSGVSFSGVSVDNNPQVRLELYDEDLENDDLMGTFTLTSKHLLEVHGSGEPQWVPTDDPELESIWAVKIEVY